MNKKAVLKLSRRVLLGALAVAMLISVPLNSASKASAYEASHIQRLEEDAVKVDYTDYLDSSVVYRLPDGVSNDEEISVIINLDMSTIMEAYESSDKTMSLADFAFQSQQAADINAAIAAEKERVLAALNEQGVAYTVGEEYNTLLCGFEVRILAGDFAATCSVLGDNAQAVISEKYAVCETQLVENNVSVYDTGIVDSTGVSYDGSGMVVAVLDTGLDSDHSAFDPSRFTSDTLGLTYEEVASVLNDTVASTMVEGLTVDDVYVNDKVPFAFDYADGDPDAYSTHNNHGTHVSGIIVGQDDTITGVAPNAQLVAMKIFSDTYDSALSSWILSALEDCVILGVDVINMSLGTAAGFSRESDEEIMNGVYDKIREAGISMIVAASNSYSSAYGSEANGNLPLTSNPDSGTVGSPSTYDGAMSVASINGVETPYLLFGDTIIYFDESNDNAGNEQDFVAPLLGDQESAELEYVIVPGVGRSADYTGLDVEGKIALVRRGDNTFEEKAIIAQAQGAVGIIIYNNVSGEIKMNVGDATLAACSISQDDGEMLVAAGNGKLKISKKQTSGPFIDDFSSWGPAPDLSLKPEITTHGGNILSAVTGGSYDRLSGTSMATPNLAGMVILLRQYVVENFPEIADNSVEVNHMVNRLMMSTADIILNTNGLPYAVRKQGAGLANLISSVETPAYIATYDENGKEMDKTKLELGDDPEKNGVYEMSFSVVNLGDKTLSYELGSYILTEGVSDTKTNAGETTVTEEAYALTGAVTEIVSVNGEEFKGKKITVKGGETVDVTVVITLGEEDKAYLDESFANGMYVEGFITLEAASGTDIDLSVPYLAFYGDWTQAPMFDLTYYETNADELDDSIAVEDKVMADAYATRPIGGLYDDYVSYLGSYYFLQDPADMVISASEDYIALSNQEGTVHSLRFVWAGMLRAAERIEITITNDTTGEVVFETVDDLVRKSYGDGGSIYPANIEIEFDTQDYNLANNGQYTVRLEGYMDYEDGGFDTNEKNIYTFPLTIDFEAPTITDVEFYYEYDDNEDKNRLYAKVGIYDNHYAMCMQVGYVANGTDEEGNATPEMKAFDQYMTPVYSQCDSTTYVTYELTDHVFDIKEGSITPNTFVITTYDYAMNYATYEIGLPDDYQSFYYEGLEEGLTLSPNEVFSLEPVVTPDSEWAELLEFASSKPSVVRVVNNKLVAAAPGVATIRIRDPKTNESMTFNVTVLSEDDEGYRRYDKPVADRFELTGYTTTRAYYIVNNEDKDIGDTGNVRFFEGNFNLSMYPSESVTLNYALDAYFPNDTTVAFESSNESIVTVDEYGNITAVEEGFANVTIKVLMDDRSTYYSETVSVEVKDPWLTSGASLTNYYGNGGLVTIPEDLDLKEIGAFSFANYEYVMKTEEELAIDDASISKQWFIGDTTITKVVIPEGVEKINAYAFANLTGLEEVVFPSTLEHIDYGAFYNCTSLQKITFSGENNLKVINQSAFEGCDLQDTLELSAVCVISDYAFAGNRDLEAIVLADTLTSIGQYAFAGCKSLTDVTINAAKVQYGDYAFTGCESLESIYVNTSVIPAGMFYECKSLTKVTLGADVNAIGEYAFRTTKVSTFEIAEGNKTFRVGSGKYVLSADGSKVCAVSPLYSGAFTAADLPAGVTTVGWGAFSHNTAVSSVELPAVTLVEGYGFASCDSLASVSLGSLTAIGEYAFSESPIAVLPAFTADTQIGRYAFAFTGVVEVVIPDGMTLAEGVFSECPSLTTVTIGNDVTLGDYTFNMNKDNAFEVLYYTEPGLDGEEERYYYYNLLSNLTSVTIGNNVVIGESAFAGAAVLESVTLGENATIGKMAFYNNCALKDIDLSKALSIGDYAFSGDVYYVCMDDAMAYAAVSKEGQYIYSYHGPQLESIDLSAVESIGEYAFSYCRELKSVVINPALTELPQYAFAGCIALESIAMPGVTTIGDYAFIESGLRSVDLSAVESIGEYAFVSNKQLAAVTLNPNGVTLAEGAFAECSALTAVENMAGATDIGPYAFALTGLVELDLTGAVKLGDQAFLKAEFTPVTVVLGTELTEVGDNPFAMCLLEPFTSTDEETGAVVTTFDVSDSVHVIDGSLYCDVPNGMELITYAGEEVIDVQVAEDTVRISALAFAGTDVQMVTMPASTTSIGHKAFYGCQALDMLVFGSYYAPVLEEEFDSAYYESFLHIPGTGEFGTYTDYDGTEVTINGMGLLPYYMWNITDGMYSNVFYGANFVDYVGYVEDKLTMVRPVNGVEYDSFIYNQYFDLAIDGAAGPDDVTLAAIRAIKAIPERVTLDDADLVVAARTAYDKIATTLQRALVTNYSDLITAEQRITALSAAENEGEGDVEGDVIVEEETPADPVKLQKTVNGLIAILLLVLIAVALGGWMLMSKLGIQLGSQKEQTEKTESDFDLSGKVSSAVAAVKQFAANAKSRAQQRAQAKAQAKAEAAAGGEEEAASEEENDDVSVQ